MSPSDRPASQKKFDLTLTVSSSEAYSIASARSAGSCQDGVLTINQAGVKTWVIDGVPQSDWNE